jgi:hypothetical protein
MNGRNAKSIKQERPVRVASYTGNFGKEKTILDNGTLLAVRRVIIVPPPTRYLLRPDNGEKIAPPLTDFFKKSSS